MSLNPSQISSHIKNKDFLIAEDAIIKFIQFNKDDKNTLILAKPVTENILQNVSDKNKIENEIVEQLCNEYATVISELFCHPQYKPSHNIINWFLTCKYVIEWLFSASIWRNTDAIIEHLGLAKLDKFGQIKLNTNMQKLTLLLALILLSSKFKLPWKLLFKANPAIALSSYIGLVTQPIPALSVETNKGFNHLLESAKDLPMLDLPVITDLGKLNYGFFNCSYATSPNKYEFKKWLTSLIRHNLHQWVDDTTKNNIANMSSLNLREKPKVAVMLELYSENHAMYRCFNTGFINLSEKYQLIAFIDEDDVEGADLSAFDRVVTFDGVYNINENSNLITNENPDIIFYTSIGMKFWGVYLSQLRLAPLQIMLAGHPSSSFSPEMDYCLLFRWSTNIEQLQPFFSEKIIMGDIPTDGVGFHTIHSGLSDSFLSEHNHFLNSDEKITIGINGILTKVTADVIYICKKIQQGTSKKLTFLFFSGHKSNQLAYLAAKKQLSRELKHFELISFTDYISYMKTISQCHFLLPTLPFGGSNSNIDAMVLNKPKLFIRGTAQIYTVCDQWEWERLGLGNELGCNDENELISKSLQLIDDTQYRKHIHELLVEKCSLKKIFPKNDDGDDLLSDVFAKALDHALSHSN
ncbi:hypothetical protein [Paraglaciecola arctica]|uniref:HMW1C N-terminal domain-containing protein n=1 Tax=Paraglaciecola arctica BSs20135 TaxID=493475 RepID=K6XHE9_9ALTE|nr:hypothetical protein [Paraglaciecola arctica]GAC20084.1 hypothetical protein GARC_3125 [Paraglaciecola arctica BSs20135]